MVQACEWDWIVLLPSGLSSLSGCHCRFSRQLWADRLLLDPWWPRCLPSAHLQVRWGSRKDKEPNLFHLLSLVPVMHVSLCFPFSFYPIVFVHFLILLLIFGVFYILCPILRIWQNYIKVFVVFPQPEAISTFTSEPALVSFAKFFCKTSDSSNCVS